MAVSSSRCNWRAVLPVFAVVIVIALETTWAGEAPIRHVGRGSADEMTQCITANTGLRVLVHDDSSRRFTEIQCQLGQPRPDTVNQIQQHGFRVLTNDQWAFLVPDEAFTGGWPYRVSWTGLNVNIYIEQTPAPSGPTIPSKVLAFLKEKLVTDSRLIPVQPTVESLTRPVAQVDLRYEIYTYKGAAQNVFLVGLLHGDDDFDSLARVIFMKLTGDYVELLWDSPLFLVNAHAAELEIQDIDGDGHNEIIVRATLGQGAHGGGWQTISIFNDRGEEITRQPECKWMRGDIEAGPDRVCPIAGRGGVDLRKTNSGVLIEAVQAPAKGGDAVYKLEGGHFVLARNARKQLYPPAQR